MRAVVGVSLRPGERLATLAMRWASDAGTRLDLVHCWTRWMLYFENLEYVDFDASLERREARLRALVATAGDATDLVISHRLVRGAVPAGLAQVAREVGASRVVLGAMRGTACHGDRVARRIARLARCPVLRLPDS